VGELARVGTLTWEGREIRLEDVSEVRPGMSFAFIMDTRPCASAVQLARQTELMVMESTYLDSESAEAKAYLHSTAKETANVAVEAGARRLVLAHFSQRYENVAAFEGGGTEHPS
jgi:ribonuclease Z